MRLKFELTNQDSEGEKNCTVLRSMYVNRKGIAVGQLFSLETNLVPRAFPLKVASHFYGKSPGNEVALETGLNIHLKGL